MQKLIEILQELHSDVDWETESKLIDRGLIDSFDIIALVGELNDAFGVHIELEHLTPENFNTVDAIVSLLEALGAKVSL
ncbi:MAG: acyl carrier protein [Defluviitaleaceae bacterium]|nr:acyl carrier protein [Defluviitaleaceae bacterium]